MGPRMQAARGLGVSCPPRVGCAVVGGCDGAVQRFQEAFVFTGVAGLAPAAVGDVRGFGADHEQAAVV